MAKKLRFKFSRGNKLKYIAHLDLLRTFERAIKRAELPVAYSQGFNPRPKIIFGLPMPIGLTSKAEYADIEFKENVNPGIFESKLNLCLPDGLKVIKAAEKNNRDNIMNQISAARYTIIFDPGKVVRGLDDMLHDMLSKEEIFVLKKTKKGLRYVNIRPMIYSLSLSAQNGNTCSLDGFLSAGAENNLRIDVLMDALSKETGINLTILSMHRYALYCNKLNRWMDPFEVLNYD